MPLKIGDFMCYNFSIALDSRFGKESTMGKSLKRKECGKRHTPKKGRVIFRKILYQRRGTARKYFKSLPEAKNWLADTKYELRHRVITCNSDMSVDNWFDYWITNIICNRSPNCIRNYTERYKRNVQPVIGTMCMGDVKPMHCQIILNRMESTYAGSTIRQDLHCHGYHVQICCDERYYRQTSDEWRAL